MKVALCGQNVVKAVTPSVDKKQAQGKARQDVETVCDVPEPVVEILDGALFTTSLNVAKVYGKRHDNVLHDIKAVLNDCPPETNLLNFQEIKYTDSRGRSYPAYRLSRDGLVLLVMGYNGPKAMKHKLAYMAAFNAMEAELKKRVALPTAIQMFFDRVDLNKQTVSDGYFGVFHEIAVMIPELIAVGVPIDEHTVPDISVGQKWSQYWEENELCNKHGARLPYHHVYPPYFSQAKAKHVDAWQYPDSALSDFRRWFKHTYLSKCFPCYLQRKVKKKDIPAPVAVRAIEAFKPKAVAG